MVVKAGRVTYNLLALNLLHILSAPNPTLIYSFCAFRAFLLWYLDRAFSFRSSLCSSRHLFEIL